MLTTFLTIWLLHVAALATPGANVLLVSHLAASGGRRGASWAALGVALGAVLWATAAVLGVGVLFAAFPRLRLVLQVAGAAYLILVAWRLWQARADASEAGEAHARASTPMSALRAGLLTNLSNPKAALFFGSVFSAALPASPSAAVLGAVVALVFVNALAWHGLLAFVFSRRVVRDGYAMQRGVMSRVAGALVGAVGMSLLLASVREGRR